MRRYCVIYKTNFGSAEFWVYADCKTSARMLFRQAYIDGELDYETNGTIISVEEID